jgi:dihydrofolate reductase
MSVGRLVAFTNVTLDGYFSGLGGDLGWAKTNSDPEYDAFVADNAKSGGGLLLGRITYDMMASYWPTPQAARNDPAVAESMNRLPKVVFSRTMSRPSWSNTILLKGDLPAEVRKLKQSGPDRAILGSGSIVAQLTKEGLIDEYQIMVNPVVLGQGKTLFEGIAKPLALTLTKTRSFANGNVFLCYQRQS